MVVQNDILESNNGVEVRRQAYIGTARTILSLYLRSLVKVSVSPVPVWDIIYDLFSLPGGGVGRVEGEKWISSFFLRAEQLLLFPHVKQTLRGPPDEINPRSQEMDFNLAAILYLTACYDQVASRHLLLWPCSERWGCPGKNAVGGPPTLFALALLVLGQVLKNHHHPSNSEPSLWQHHASKFYSSLVLFYSTFGENSVYYSTFNDPIIKHSAHPYIPYTCRQFPLARGFSAKINSLSPSHANACPSSLYHTHPATPLSSSHTGFTPLPACPNEAFHPLKGAQAWDVENSWWLLAASAKQLYDGSGDVFSLYFLFFQSLVSAELKFRKWNSTGQGPEQLDITVRLALLWKDKVITWFPEVPSSLTILWLCWASLKRSLSVTARCNYKSNEVTKQEHDPLKLKSSFSGIKCFHEWNRWSFISGVFFTYKYYVAFSVDTAYYFFI